MIKIEYTDVYGWIPAIRGARNPMNSWNLSDTSYGTGETTVTIGPRDLRLLRKLANAGSDHGKFLRMILVYCDITGPFYWFKELDTYRMGVEKNSCSTMHKIHAKEFELSDFSTEHLMSADKVENGYVPMALMDGIIVCLNDYRKLYVDSKDKDLWWQLIQLLPSSYNQRRTYMFSYAALRNIYHARKHHKLDEWREFCKWVETLPYSELITGGMEDEVQ